MKTFYIHTMGCKSNQFESSIITENLEKNGLSQTKKIEDADYYILNSCSVTHKSDNEAMYLLRAAKHKNPSVVTIITGCVAQIEKEKLLENDYVDLVVGNDEKLDLFKVLFSDKKACLVSDIMNRTDFNEIVLTDMSKTRASLKIQDGCDNRCSYCAIPLIRGGYIERPMENMIKEAQNLANKGIKELIIIAQDTTKYGLKLYGEYKLASLLKELVKIDGIEWIRLYYCYPDRVTDELIDVIANEEKICPYIDIPLQHCNKDILKSMNRAGSYDELKELLNKMKAKIPDFAIRTTFMVGFPNESEENFEELCKFVKEIKFDKMGCFTYSPEEDTPACSYDNQIDEEVKKRRADILMDIQYSVTEELNQNRVGNTYKVIVDGIEDGMYNGRAYFDSPEIDSGIMFKSDDKLNIGDFVNVKITACEGYDLIGEKV